MDYKADLETNFDTLPENWRDHPIRFAEWGEAHANKVAARDRAKENLEVVRAELSFEVRRDWETLGFEKSPTVDAVKDWVILQNRYQIAMDDYLTQCEEVNVLLVAKQAFEHRKKQLESLTQFLLMGIIASTPKLQGKKEPLGDPDQNLSEKTETEMKKKLKPKRRIKR